MSTPSDELPFFEELATHEEGVLTKIVGDQTEATTTCEEIRTLTLCFLGTEPKMPYGPVKHTAQLFFELFEQVIEANNPLRKCWLLRMEVFDVQKGEFPQEKQVLSYDGYILPGSFSAAYDTEKWIEDLKSFIQENIVRHEIPTLGICFGHQILAHSFEDGNVIATPSGPRAGPYEMKMTEAGKQLLKWDSIPLFYSHGDCVEKLPSCATKLAGSDTVSVLAAVYKSEKTGKPYAITFQAHPEFASSKDLGLYRTLGLIMDAMKARKALTEEQRVKQWEKATLQYESVQRSSLDLVASVFQHLGWLDDP